NLEKEQVKKQKSSEEPPEIETTTKEFTEYFQLKMFMSKPFKSNTPSLTGRQLDMEDMNQLWALVKEYLSIRPASKWKLYDLSGVHHVTAKDKEIFMLVEKDYPLRRDPDLSFHQSTPVFIDPKSSTQADGALSSRVPVPLPEDPYEVIRQAYLVGTDTESEPFEGKARTPESPYIVAPPTCHVEESEGYGTSGARSTSSDSTTPLLPDHSLTLTTPALVLIFHRTTRMAVRILLAMLHGLSTGIAEVAAMSDSAFCKRFWSSYDSSPSSTLPVRKSYKGTSELILGTDSEEDGEVEKSLDSDSESEGAKDEGPTAEEWIVL
nr:hypothetical protein [Tanacetum cinerariifolium]